jgi:hypothetical protein
MALVRWFQGLIKTPQPEDYAPGIVYSIPPSSHADDYPDVPEPEDLSTPRMLALRWTTGDLHPEDLHRVAADLLEIGYDTDWLRRLAGEFSLATSADAEPIVSRVFHELEIPYPMSKQEARTILIRQIAREVIAGKRNPWAAASHIEIVVCGWNPDTEDLEKLFVLHDELNWEEVYRRPISLIGKDLLDIFARLAMPPLSEL